MRRSKFDVLLALACGLLSIGDHSPTDASFAPSAFAWRRHRRQPLIHSARHRARLLRGDGGGARPQLVDETNRGRTRQADAEMPNLAQLVQPKSEFCYNGGQFEQGACRCLAGFQGDLCQDRDSRVRLEDTTTISPLVRFAAQRTFGCQSLDCQNESSCVNSYEARGYYCKCRLGFIGKNCEHGTPFHLAFTAFPSPSP